VAILFIGIDGKALGDGEFMTNKSLRDVTSFQREFALSVRDIMKHVRCTKRNRIAKAGPLGQCLEQMLRTWLLLHTKKPPT
jgi:hypothetical protein